MEYILISVHETNQEIRSVSVTYDWSVHFSGHSSTSKTDFRDIAEILLKVTLNTIKPNQKPNHSNSWKCVRLVVLIGSKETKEQIQKQKQNRHNQLMLPTTERGVPN